MKCTPNGSLTHPLAPLSPEREADFEREARAREAGRERRDNERKDRIAALAADCRRYERIDADRIGLALEIGAKIIAWRTSAPPPEYREDFAALVAETNLSSDTLYRWARLAERRYTSCTVQLAGGIRKADAERKRETAERRDTARTRDEADMAADRARVRRVEADEAAAHVDQPPPRKPPAPPAPAVESPAPTTPADKVTELHFRVEHLEERIAILTVDDPDKAEIEKKIAGLHDEITTLKLGRLDDMERLRECERARKSLYKMLQAAEGGRERRGAPSRTPPSPPMAIRPDVPANRAHGLGARDRRQEFRGAAAPPPPRGVLGSVGRGVPLDITARRRRASCGPQRHPCARLAGGRPADRTRPGPAAHDRLPALDRTVGVRDGVENRPRVGNTGHWK